MTLTRARQAEVIEIATYAAIHHPWRASAFEVIDLNTDFDSRYSNDTLNTRGRAAKSLFDQTFATAYAEVVAKGAPGGGLCDSCKKPVELGRFNKCVRCGAIADAE